MIRNKTIIYLGVVATVALVGFMVSHIDMTGKKVPGDNTANTTAKPVNELPSKEDMVQRKDMLEFAKMGSQVEIKQAPPVELEKLPLKNHAALEKIDWRGESIANASSQQIPAFIPIEQSPDDMVKVDDPAKMFVIPPHPVALSSMLADTESEELQKFKENRQTLKKSFEEKLNNREARQSFQGR